MKASADTVSIGASNAQVADVLRRYAAALSLEGANRFKLKAYRKAAQTIEGLDEDIATLIARGRDLTDLPGIGKAISAIVTEVVSSGKLDRLDRTVARLKPELVELASRPGLDPKKVTRAYKKLGISSLAELKQALDDGRIAASLGPRMEYHIRQGLDERPRSLLWSVRSVADTIERSLRSMPGVTKVAPTGSFRRKKDTVGDLGFLVAGRSADAIFKHFKAGGVLSSRACAENERSFALSSGLTVTLRWTPAEEWGPSLIFATGSALHLSDLSARADEKSIRLTPQGLSAKGIDAAEEAAVYAGLGLCFIEPELREGRGEVKGAAWGKLPTLIERHDIRGDLHMHTTESDGVASIGDMVAAAQAHGYEYIGITDHSQSLKLTNGLSEKRLLEQVRTIDKRNESLTGFRILKSSEVDILADGTLDYPSAVLKELDYTICSIHSRFGLDKEQQTERILRAMDNRYFTILGHATGRLLLRRPGYELDMDRIIEHAKDHGCYFEINSSPDRLDLSDEHARLAKAAAVKIAINTDAHSPRELDFMAAGIHQARRGWLTAADVLNTRSLEALLRLFRR